MNLSPQQETEPVDVYQQFHQHCQDRIQHKSQEMMPEQINALMQSGQGLVRGFVSESVEDAIFEGMGVAQDVQEKAKQDPQRWLQLYGGAVMVKTLPTAQGIVRWVLN